MSDLEKLSIARAGLAGKNAENVRLRKALERLSEVIYRFKHFDDDGGMVLEMTWRDSRGANPAEFARLALEGR